MNARLPSNRNFGLLFSGFFAFLFAYGFYQEASTVTIYGWLIAGSVVGLITITAPELLMPFNKAWMKFGELIGTVVSPIVLGIIFFFLITPVAQISRLFGRDELRIKKVAVSSFWINRSPPGPSGDSFKNQF